MRMFKVIPFFLFMILFMGIALLLMSGQAAITYTPVQAAAEAATLASSAPNTDIGVIPGPNGCGHGLETISIRMDDEDTKNKDSHSGWIGAIRSTDNTTFIFCRVDGTRFKPLALNNDDTSRLNYVTLRLGDQCPNGAKSFSRYFDNQDDSGGRSNANNVNGNIWPNNVNDNTRLEFCLFSGIYYDPYYSSPDDAYMTEFPKLRFEYGVFAPSNFELALETGALHTDDEDKKNTNGYGYDVDISESDKASISTIIAGNDNTDLQLASVYTPPNEFDQDCNTTSGYCNANPRPIDLTISLYRSAPVGSSERISYTQIISYFADAIYEMSNGSHIIRDVTIYQNEKNSSYANVVWVKKDRAHADPSGYHKTGQLVMSDIRSNDVIRSQEDAGYTLGHEWGHYYYGLMDEYVEKGQACPKDPHFSNPCEDDIAILQSVMNDQTAAIGGDFRWLNFSYDSFSLTPTFTHKNAQYRVYEASGWETLSRNIYLDPGEREPHWEEHCTKRNIFNQCTEGVVDARTRFIPRQFRVYFPELTKVAATDGLSPTLQLPGEQSKARDKLGIIWVDDATPSTTSFDLATDHHSGNNSSVNFPFYIEPGVDSADIVLEYGETPNPITLVVHHPTGQNQQTVNCTVDPEKEGKCQATITNPATGEWTGEVQIANPPQPIKWTVIGHHTGGLPYQATVAAALGADLTYPLPAVIIASVYRELPIARADVVANVKTPDGQLLALLLKDDGVAPDKLADDGRYTSYLAYNADGDYRVNVNFNNNANNAMFTAAGLSDGNSFYPVGENFARGASTVVTISGYKVDDHGNTPLAATRLPADDYDTPGRIDYANDVDVFAITPTVTGKLVVRVTGLGQGMQPRLRIIGNDQSSILKTIEDTPGATTYPFATVDATANTPIYAAISHMDANAIGGTYFVSTGQPLASGGESSPLLQISSSAFTFHAIAGGSNPSVQTLTINNVGPGTLNWTASEAIPWLTLSKTTGTAPETINVTIDVSGLAAQTYTDKIQISDGTNSIDIPVTLVVSAATTPVPITLQVDPGEKSMELSWNVTNDPLVTKYRVLRSPTTGDHLQAVASDVVNTTYFDTDDNAGNDLQTGTTYCYQVEALRADNTVSIKSTLGCGLFGLLDLWVPDTIGKPGETVIVPINIRNAEGLQIAASDVWMDFDPRVIESVNISRTALTVAYAWAYSVQVVDAATSRVRIAYIHSDLNNPPPKLKGDGALFWLTFKVKGQAGATSPLNLKEFITSVGGSSIQNQDLADVNLNLTDGLFTVEGPVNASFILGDVDADTVVRARDAALALRLANGERAATKQELQAGDINGNAKFDAADSTMILHYAAKGAWPMVTPTQVNAAKLTEPVVTTGVRVDNVQGKQGQTVQTTLRATSVSGMAGGSFTLVYDPNVVSAITSVTKTGLAANFADLEFQANGDGILTLSLANDSEVSGDGDLVTINLTLAANAPVGVFPLRLADARINNLLGRDFVISSTGNTLTRESAQITVQASDPVNTHQNVYLPVVSR